MLTCHSQPLGTPFTWQPSLIQPIECLDKGWALLREVFPPSGICISHPCPCLHLPATGDASTALCV